MRYEQDEAVLTGSWITINHGRASNGSYAQADTAGESAAFSFTGTWVNLGFIADRFSGQADILIDGVSQGSIDLYRREDTPLSFVYDGLPPGNHTLTVVALGTTNPLALNDFVRLDYLDVYNGGSYADGFFEQDDNRLFRSTGWSNVNDANASGGSYQRSGNATMWFPFTGDTVTYQAVAYPTGGLVQIALDGVYQTTLDLYNPLESITRTLSFDGLGAGPHILQVSTYRNNATIDGFATPGTSPFYAPPGPVGSFHRYEEDDPAFLYNGLPYTTTATSWSRSTIYPVPSDGQTIYANTAGDTASLTFTGTWVSLGFMADEFSGQAEVFLDGVSQGTVDLYRNERDVTSVTYADLTPGTHTISVTVLGTANPLSGNAIVHVDYVDVWDGTSLPDGSFEELHGRVYLSGGWTNSANAGASGGTFNESSQAAIAWFPFTGDSVTYQALDYFRSDEAAIYIDDVLQGYYDLRTGLAPTITHSFDNLGPGLHMLKIRGYRRDISLDAFHTPAISPPAPTPTPTVFTRYEEDAPRIRYNGLPYTQTARSWDRPFDVSRASDGQIFDTYAPGDSVSLDFAGTWIGVGFATSRLGGQVEVTIDGVSQGMVDLYTPDDGVLFRAYGDLSDTAHTITLTLLASRHPNSSGTGLLFDYFETWSGDPLPSATYEEDHPLVYRSDLYDDWDAFAEPSASSGAYIRSAFQAQSTAWFPFTGDSVTFMALANNVSDRVSISIDGEFVDTFNLYSATPTQRPLSFDGLGEGPHMLEVRYQLGYINVDAFVVPGIAPFYVPPVLTGIVRYEEDNTAVVYNNSHDFRTRPQSWAGLVAPQASRQGNASTTTPGDSVSLTFHGRWVNLGFRTRSRAGEAEVFIDGQSQGLIDLTGTGEDNLAYQFGDLITGTHTISVVHVSGTMYFDYFDVWDGEPMPDDIVNARRSEDNPRLHYSSGLAEISNPNGIEGDLLISSLLNTNSNIWYTFVGDAFSYYGFSRNNTTFVELYVDGVLIDTIDQSYPFSEQPIVHHYTGFGDGPHEVRVHNGLYLRTDAFASNPASLAPYQPLVEWYDDEPAGNGAPFFGTVGIAASVAAGDVTGDGQIEIVVTADDVQNFGTLFLYHGDGRDSGDGDPIIWEIPFGGGAYRTWLGTPTIGDLDGQPGAEIIVNVGDELYALHADGTTYWVTDTVSAFEVMSAPALANLDTDPAPEIVVNVGNTVYIFEPDGTKLWETTLPAVALPPVVADLTGDGLPDLFLSAWDDTVYLYEYNSGTPQLAWSQTMPGTLAGMFGSAAVANVDGLQPGGDAAPELVVSSNGFLTVLKANGDELWTTPLDPGNPGGVSVADLDGDGEVELVTGMRYDDGVGIGRLYALNADGTMLWEAPAYDSSSANIASVLDLNGDGVYEVAWNGKEQGFTLFNGADGSVLFNEPLALSVTGTDYPAIVDVDLDGYAEVIVPALRGIRVFGMDGAWGPARSVWNQQTYHITNVNDDLTIPEVETNSWATHNTYRTQWPESSALPVYDVVLTHTAGINNQTVLTNTFSNPPSHSADPVYRWEYTQTWAQQTVTRTFGSELTDLQPGETRQVAAGTEVAYRLPSGFNTLTLPPLYVTAPRLGELTPAEQTAAVGSTAVYTLTLSNPTATPATYSLAPGGLPAEWLSYPASVEIGAGETVAVNINAAVPVNTSPDSLPLWVDVDNGNGGVDSFQATLHLVEAVWLALEPASQTGTTGQPLSYTLTISNLETAAQSYALTAVGLAEVSFSGSPTVTVPASSALEVLLTAVPPAVGPQPFAITATNAAGASAVADGVAVGVGRWAVLAEATPETVVAGPGSTAVVTLTLSNAGDMADTYALSMDAPAGWESQLTHVGQPVSEMGILAGAFNTADLRWRITPALAAQPGNYPVTVTAQSLSQPGVWDTAVVWVQVGERGVTVEISPANQAINPNAPASWNVTVTNRGSVADSYALSPTGVPALAGSFSAETTGSLAPGASQTVQLTTEALDFLLPGTRQFAVLAQSVGDVRVQAEDTAVFTLADAPGVAIEWLPASKTVTDTLTTGLMLVLTNTGGTLETVDLTVSGAGLLAQPTLKRLVVSPQSAVAVWVPVWAATAGQYEVTATASGAGTPASATADLVFASTNIVEPNFAPTVDAGADVATLYNTAVLFSGSYLDPDGPAPYTVAWDFGDGNTASGSLTASHSYATEGVYTVTLTVTDGLGAVGTDTLQVTVTYPTTYLPIIMRAP
ncbi:MAG: PKD domain-containing protein [Anaerolineales bacterium]|nr:PKD domain-containing protein [Anaerolineales bacterium]